MASKSCLEAEIRELKGVAYAALFVSVLVLFFLVGFALKSLGF